MVETFKTRKKYSNNKNNYKQCRTY